jgi:hypothetical protein
MLEKYEIQTIEAMFYELDLHQDKQHDFEIISDYFFSVVTGLKNFFRTSEYDGCRDTVILI